jgi:hypothetical protein
MADFTQYETLFFIKYKEDAKISNLLKIVRALPYVDVANNKSDKSDSRPQGLILIKVITTKSAKETFDMVRDAALKQIPDITTFKYSERHIEGKEI